MGPTNTSTAAGFLSSYPSAIGKGDRFAFVDAAFMVSCCDGSLDARRWFVESESA